MFTALKRLYRAQFRPSAALEKPYAMVGVNLFAADTNEAALRLFTSLQQQFINLRRGTPGQLQPPVEQGRSGGDGIEWRRAFARVLGDRR